MTRKWWSGVPLASTLEDADNSYNLVRLGAAAMVVVSHSYFILGGGNAFEPLAWSAYDLGALAVNMFFVLSGVMISRSLEMNRDVGRYLRARLLRIYPGMAFAAIVTALVIGPMATELSLADYFRDPATWLYSARALVDFSGAPLPGFDHGIHEANAPLWTIKFELLAYAGCLALAIVGLAGNRIVWLVASLISGAVVASGFGLTDYSADAVANLSRFVLAFSAGAVAYQFRHALVLNLPLALLIAALSIGLGKGPVGSVIGVISMGYLALTLGATGLPPWLSWTKRTDISYGLYLFSWPVQQALVHWSAWASASVPVHIATTLLLALPLAYLSWIMVERPALRLK